MRRPRWDFDKLESVYPSLLLQYLKPRVNRVQVQYCSLDLKACAARIYTCIETFLQPHLLSPLSLSASSIVHPFPPTHFEPSSGTMYASLKSDRHGNDAKKPITLQAQQHSSQSTAKKPTDCLTVLPYCRIHVYKRHGRAHLANFPTSLDI